MSVGPGRILRHELIIAKKAPRGPAIEGPKALAAVYPYHLFDRLTDKGYAARRNKYRTTDPWPQPVDVESMVQRTAKGVTQ
jgi:hypothetical protein